MESLVIILLHISSKNQNGNSTIELQSNGCTHLNPNIYSAESIHKINLDPLVKLPIY